MENTFSKAAGLLAVVTFVIALPAANANVLFFSGNLRTDANVTSCGPLCTLGVSSSDGDYAQWAAVVDTFQVLTPSTMTAVTTGYGLGGLEPYLSLFDGGGNYLASTFFGTLCPPGAVTVAGQCLDVMLDGGVLQPGTYQIALSAWENMSSAENLGSGTLADGFTGLGNLNSGESLTYAFHVTLTSTSSAPEPESLTSLGIGLALCALHKFRSSKTTGGSI